MGDIGPEQVRRRAKELTAADVEQGIREGRFFFQKIDLPPAVLAQFVTGALHQLFQWWLEVPNEYTPKQMVDMIFRMFAGLI
jgi:hypothetical protein